jgi:rhodanese-related sulfurtransferase
VERLAAKAVELMRKEGFQAIRLEDGVTEWRAYGLPVAMESS